MKEFESKDIGDKIFYARKRAKMSRVELGKKLGLHEVAIKKYEDGEIKSLDINKLMEFSIALDISFEYLIGLDNSNNPITSNTGEIIKFLREKNNLTQEELAQKLGLKKAAINKYETGRVQNIKKETIQKMSEVFNVSPSYIMFGSCINELSLGEKLNFYRKKSGFTQQQVADKANISRSHYASLESDKYNPSIDTLNSIANILNIDIAVLFNKNKNSIIIDDKKDLLNNNNDDIGKRLKELLDRENINQRDLAIMIGSSESTISRYIQNKRVPYGETLSKLATALNTTSDYILTGKSNVNTKYIYKEKTTENLKYIIDDFRNGKINSIYFGDTELTENNIDMIEIFIQTIIEFSKRK